MAQRAFLRGLRLLRLWLVVGFAASLLAACGGGGGDSGGGGTRYILPGNPAIQGTWHLTVAVDDGAESPPVEVDASAVPSSSEVAALTTSAVAELFGRTAFQAYTVTQAGTTITVTDSDTNYMLVIDSVDAANYQDCGTCFVGTSVTFDVVVNYTESGRIDGRDIATATRTFTLHFRYRRVS